MVPVLTLWMAAVLQLSHAAIYTNDWAVKVNGNRQCVDRIAAKYGFINMGQIGDLKGYYSFRHPETASRSTVSNKEVTGHIAKEDKVEWLQQQVVHKRAKRTSRGGGPIHRAGTGAERFAEPLHFTDPEWNSLQYIHCRDDSKGCQPGMNIEGAWRMGYTGKGVVVSVLDDGIEREHPDLEPNYDPLASYDVNGQDQDPTPSYPDKAANYHGTLCAGMIAAAANNSLCTVGVSFRARIGGVRMLAGDVTDIVEAQSLSFRPQYIDIYLASWGPEDDGATVEGPGYLTRLALQNSVQTGRHGMGSVFVGASGNGGRAGDHCSCDGYSNSIYTISISSTSRHGHHPDYLEQCSSTLAAAYGGEETVTLGPQQTCRRTLSGTSLSSSVAAGILALMLEANPSLTWRDVQHIIVRTSKADHLTAPDWHRNGAGYKVSHLYGFGLLDAEGMVKEAESWKQVPPQHECVEDAAIQLSRLIHPGSVLTSEYETKGCSGEAPQHVVYLEHVVVRVTISHSRRGDLSITLTSPSGTVSQMLANRPLDNSTEGFQDWEFMTVHCWGEQAAGKWTLKIQDTLSYERGETKPGVLEKWSLVMFGTAELPYSSAHRLRTRAAEIPAASDVTEEYNGPCDPECSEDGCDGPGPQQCVTCLHFFLKFKNNTRLCVSECPAGFWGDRRRCKRCFSFCQSCTGSRSDQCTSCQPGYHLTEETSTCSASCGDNYYLDHDTNLCRKCSENCLKCTSYSICTECKQDTSLQGNRCQPSCAPGFYHDTQEGTCKPCHTACATCAGAGSEACSLCAEGFFTEEWRCVSSCSPGFYSTEPSPENADGQRICRRCDASCLTCAGPSRGNCSSCSRAHSLQDGVCVINTACADGEYPDSEGLCHPCDSTCLKCTGRRSQDCISCAPSRVLDEGRCLEACAKGKYPSGGRCHLCDHTCAACVDAGPSNCTSCDTDKFGMERYLHQGLCVETCPEAFFHTEKTCEPCSQDCQLCSSLNRCLKCNPSFYLSDGRCVKLECGEGEVEDPDYDDCMACEEGCKKCVLYNPRHCLSCIDGFYNFQDGCYRNCPAKTYSVEEEMSCVPCDDNCVSCDEHECYWCETDLFLSDGKCVSVCPDGFYGDEDSSECEECHADCDTCSGPEEDDCLSCEEGKMLESSLCVPDDEACPIKTFLSDDGACEDCHPSCESCSGHEKNQCTKCANGRFLTLQQTCVSKCPTGFFASRLSGVCEECPPGCLQCVNAELCSRCLNSRRTLLFLQDGKCVQECVRGYPVGQLCRSCAPGCASCERNATHCVSCEEPLLLHKHQCVEECPEGHTARDRQCHHCPAACRDCTALGECTDCEEYHFLHEGLCVQSCPERFYEDNERGECSRCHSDCALCDGPSGSDCDACVDPEATLHNGACLPSCPPNTYRDAVTAECQDCDESCLTCSGPDVNSCTSCRDDWKLDDHSRCTPSSSKCSSHQYSDSDGKCHPCHKYCHRCWGPGKDHCLSCSQRHFLLNGSCVDECPAGYFKEESGQKCEPCHASCQTCVGKNSLQCLTCKAHLFREAKECVETCQPGHYGNSDSRTCEKCDPSCGECTDGGEEDCLSCSLGLVYLRNEGRCLPSCPPGYHRDSSHRTCEPCHSSCRTCSGKFESCESCFPGYQLSDGRCKSMCDPGQHPVSEGSHYTCEDCDSSCLECRAAGPFNCTACPDQAILEAGGRCLPCCQHEEDGGGDATAQQDCCNCTETRGECVLSTNLPFRNSEEEEARGNLTIFIIACILLVLALVGVALLVRHSRSKGKQSDLPPRGYEKLGSGRFGAGYSSASTASYSGPASSSGGRFQDQLVDIGRAGSKDDDDDDDEDDEDIVYMGKDGTVYRKFRYGQLGEDNDDELEYDDESYTFR